MKVATWNVNGIRARQSQFLEWIERDQPEIICLQELKASPAQLADELCNLAGHWCYWHGSRAYSGVGLHIRRQVFNDQPVFSHPAFDHENRIVEAAVGNLVIASVYVPNGGKDYPAKLAFMKAMRQYVKAVHDSGRQLVLCGDLNVARTDKDVHPKERKPNIIGQRPEERELLEAIISEGLTDVGRALDPENENLFTWWAPWRNLRQRNIGWRLDYVLASETLAQKAVSCPVLKDVGTSDHAPVVAEFAIEVAPGQPHTEPEGKPQPPPGTQKSLFD